MNNCCKYILTLILLLFESGAEALLYNNTENVKPWLISLLSLVNYATAWFCFVLTSEHELTLVDPENDYKVINEQTDFVNDYSNEDSVNESTENNECVTNDDTSERVTTNDGVVL